MRGLGLAVVALLFFSACNPTVHGECKTNGDCLAGTMCVEGICLYGEPDGSTGTGSCAPACGAGEQCVSGLCLSTAPASVAILSPNPGGTFGAIALPVSVKANAPDGVTSVAVRLIGPMGIVLSSPAKAGEAPDTYSASINLGDPSVRDGSYKLVAALLHGGHELTSTGVPLSVVREAPTIRIEPIAYPQRPLDHPSAGAFLRSDTVEVDAQIYDTQSGLSAQPPTLSVAGMPPVAGTAAGQDLFRFTFSGRAPTFKAVARTDVAFQINAANSLGTVATATGAFKMSRIKWRWTKPPGSGIRAAPVLSHGLVIVAGDDGVVYGLHPDDGSEAWSLDVGGTPVGHLTSGGEDVYVPLADGHVVAVDPSDVPLNANQRLVYECPQGNGVLGTPLRPLTAGLSLGETAISGNNATTEDTVFAFTRDGYIHAFRKDAFQNGLGVGMGCVMESPGVGAQNDASPPTLLQDGSGIHLFFGDTSGMVHAFTFALSGSVGQATYQFTDDWKGRKGNVGSSVLGGIAFGALGPGNGLVAVRHDGVVDALDLAGMFLWTPPNAALPGSVRATPVIGTKAIYVQDDQGNMEGASLSSGVGLGMRVSLNSGASLSANSAPVVAGDGHVYFASGTKLAAGIEGSKTLDWTYAPTSAGSSSALSLDMVSPELSCDGTLYIVGTNGNGAVMEALITDSTTGLAPSPWPRAFHDSHNTLNPATPISTSGMCTD